MQATLFLHHLRFARRQLRAAPGQAAIVILGLALGLALALLSSAFIRDTLWADAKLPQLDRLVTLEWQARAPGGGRSDWFSDTPAAALQQALRDSGAPLGPSTKVLQTQLQVRVDAAAPGGRPRNAKLDVILADAEIESLFGLHAVAGELAATMASPEGIALTEPAAEKLFGTRDALGRTFVMLLPDFNNPQGPGLQVTLKVTAVLPAPRANGALGSYEALAGFMSPQAKMFLAQESSWWMGAGRLFAQLKPGQTPEALAELGQHLMDQQPLPPGLPADFLKGGGKAAYLRAMPVADVPLHGAGSAQRRIQMGSLLAATIGVLALAMINFVNLWSVRTLKRQREIGLRKSLGAGAGALAAQFFAEALLVSLLAGLLGLLLAWWATPAMEALLRARLDTAVFAPGMLAAAAVICVLVAVATSLPLAGIALRVRAAESLAGRSHTEGRAGRWLRRGLTVVQFAAAGFFLALTVIVLWQTRHASQLDRGFQVEGRLAYDIPFGTAPTRTQALIDRIRSWPDVLAVSAAGDVPGRNYANFYSDFTPSGGPRVGLRTALDFLPGLLDLYGVKLIAGRLSSTHEAEVAGHAVVIERSAAQVLGFASPEAAIGQTLQVAPVFHDGKPVTVVAVIDDVHLEGARDTHKPTLLVPLTSIQGGAVSVRSRDPDLTRRKLAELVQAEFPNDRPQLMSVREWQAQQYAGDLRHGQLIAVISGLALLLAAVGIYALAAYTLRLREREIVLRKLHGAGGGAIARLLAKEFAAVAGLGCLLSLPVAAWLAQGYLAGFVERAPMGPFTVLPLLLTVAVLGLVTFIAVVRHLRAALALRPVQALQG
jgi:ABC-type lipoprotein release transport system permease subunit